jgi:hypothetical protein
MSTQQQHQQRAALSASAMVSNDALVMTMAQQHNNNNHNYQRWDDFNIPPPLSSTAHAKAKAGYQVPPPTALPQLS